MADHTEGEGAEPQDPKGGEGGTPQDPQKAGQQPQDPGTGEGGQPQDTGEGEGGTVNRHKYDRDIQRREDTIADLRRQLRELTDAKAASGDQTAQLRKEMDELKRQLSDEKANAALSAAGCIDLDLARHALAACDGDVARLREAKPYLFGTADTTQRSTGGRPAGGSPDDLRKKARRAAGLKD